MWIAISVIVFASLQALQHLQHVKLENRTKQISLLEEQANLYGRLWGRMLISRQMFVDFSIIEGFQYPEDFVLLVESIDADHESQLAIRYRTLMKEVLGPIQHECLQLIMDKKWLFVADVDLSEFLLEYMLFSSSYKIIFSRWDTGDYSINFSQRRFPPDLIDSLQREYMKTKTALDSFVSSITQTKDPSQAKLSKPVLKIGDKRKKSYYSTASKAISATKPSSSF